MPGLDLVVFVEEVDGADDELGTAKVDGEGNGPVADEGEPAVDEADGGSPSGGREHGRPVVDAAGGRVDGADLGERGGDAEGDEGDEGPAVEEGDGLTVDEADGHGGGPAVGDGHDGKGQAEDANHLEVARQLALVAQVGEGNVGLMVGGGAAAVHGGRCDVCDGSGGEKGWSYGEREERLLVDDDTDPRRERRGGIIDVE